MDMNNNNNGEFSQNTQTNPYEQQNAYNQPLQQPVYVQAAKDETVSVLDWIGTILLAAVPCVGIIIYIVWAFSKDTKPSKSNFCKAQLIMMLVGIILYIILFAVIMAAGISTAMMAY